MRVPRGVRGMRGRAVRWMEFDMCRVLATLGSDNVILDFGELRDTDTLLGRHDEIAALTHGARLLRAPEHEFGTVQTRRTDAECAMHLAYPDERRAFHDRGRGRGALGTARGLIRRQGEQGHRRRRRPVHVCAVATPQAWQGLPAA